MEWAGKAEVERGFRFTTERLQATFRDGLAVSPPDRLAGESHTTSADPDRTVRRVLPEGYSGGGSGYRLPRNPAIASSAPFLTR